MVVLGTRNGTEGIRKRQIGVSAEDGPAVGLSTDQTVNPFTHSITLSTYDRIKMYILTVLLMPIRIVLVFCCLLIAYLLACLGTLGVKREDLIEKPMKGWRRYDWLVIGVVLSPFFHSKLKGTGTSAL